MQAEPQKGLSVASFHTILYCQKWAECVSFYRDVLQLPVVFENEVFLEFGPAPGARLGLIDAKRSRRAQVQARSLVLSFRVPDLREAHQFLRTRHPGVSSLKDHPWGARLFEMEDPEGRRIEFWTESS
jgi:catechol 2,3-dioxygenase-like lactoylglutathione lyase family enzyme